MTRRLWLRHETRQTERRAAIVPADAGALVRDGVTVTVEESPQRAFPAEEYAAVGCRIVPAGSWAGAPDDEVIVGLKELPSLPSALRHRHVYFGHAYKRQEGARELLARFVAGQGALLDMEYLTDDAGRRLAAFGYWAGYVGAALSVLHHRGRLDVPLRPTTRHSLDAALRPGPDDPTPRTIVVGALGRAGTGACAALEVAGAPPTRWDVAETRRLDRAALLDHDILINAVFTTAPVEPLLTYHDLDDPARRLSGISDVTCDVTSDCNVLPIYERVTTWPEPVLRLRGGDRPVDLIAIDNLPSLLPVEASVSFSADLTPLLARLDDDDSAWQRCREAFTAACRTAGLTKESTDA